MQTSVVGPFKMSSIKIKKISIWKRCVIATVVAGVLTVVVLIIFTTNLHFPKPYHEHRFVKFLSSNHNKSTPGVAPVIFSTVPSDKIIMRRKPYVNELACQNFSISLYEDETFDLTGLVSYPGSGNTWTRHLIQLATGVYTGSYYFDMELFSRGFLGEREVWHSGRTIVQKFHEKYSPRMHINRAILLIREPFPAVLSFANYLEAGHTGKAYLLPYHHKDWPKFLLQSAYSWLSLAKSWIDSPVTLLVVHYEHLRLNPVENLEKVCSFLNHSCPYLQSPCFKVKLEGSFRRPNSLQMGNAKKDVTRMAKYPTEIKSVISRGIDHLSNLLKLHGHEPIPLNLYQYYS